MGYTRIFVGVEDSELYEGENMLWHEDVSYCDRN